MTVVAELSARAERLGHGLAVERTIKVSLDRLWHILAETSPDIARELSKRQVLLDALTELEGAGRITTPKGKSIWDRTGHPALPLFIRRNVERVPSTATRDRLRHPWVEPLSWAGTARLTEPQRDALVTINAWLAAQPTRPEPLPLRERSLEIFGHEKKLDEIVVTPLFAPDRLTLDLLLTYVVHPPFVWQRIPGATGDELLVVENHNTYDSICRAATEHGAAGHPVAFAYIAYGAGNAFEASATYIADLDPPPTRVRYFGDLDVEGISIPTRASRRAADAGLLPVEPHLELYQLLLDHGRPQPATGRPRSTRWLGPLQPRADELFSNGMRLAQEWATLAELRSDAKWMTA